MPCRMGITTNPARRQQEWLEKHPFMSNWEVMAGPYTLKTKAKEEQDRLVALHGCEDSGDGGDHDTHSSRWYVYGFNY